MSSPAHAAVRLVSSAARSTSHRLAPREELRLLVEPVRPGASAGRRPRRRAAALREAAARGPAPREPGIGERFAALALPPGAGALEASAGGLRAVPAPRAGALAFEVLRLDTGAPRLVLFPGAVPGPATRPRWNGAPMPAVAPLERGDEVLLDERTRFHVTTYVEGGARVAGRDTPELLGRACGLCRLAIAPGARVVVCLCGVPLHLDGERAAPGEELDCARLGACPSCEAPVRIEGGYTWLPEAER